MCRGSTVDGDEEVVVGIVGDTAGVIEGDILGTSHTERGEGMF